MDVRYTPLFYPKQKQRSCGVVVRNKSRSRPWTSILLVAALVTAYYTLEAMRSFVVLDSFKLFDSSTETFVDLPPTYTALREWEMNLPQHNFDLPYPEGRTGRYVLFSNSRRYQVGWNNKLNDMLMNTWLAHSSNRAYVFHDFLWSPSHYPWPVSSFHSPDWIPSTPLNALISGPSAGGPWEKGDHAPRSISEAWFDIVCPKLERRIINTRDVKPQLDLADGKIIFERWRKLLSEAPERCIEVVAATKEEDPYPETFDINFWSGHRSVSIWDDFKDSPVSRLLGTSFTVQSAIDANSQLFFSDKHRRLFPFFKHNVDPFDNILSIHIRRGDFKEACLEHAAINSTFYNWNLLSFLPDKFDPPPAPRGIVLPKGRNTPENEAIFLERCLPSAAFITRKVREAREAYLQQQQQSTTFGSLEEVGDQQGSLKNLNGNRLTSANVKSKVPLDVLYIMSNDHTGWLDDLKESLRGDGWVKIVTNRDLKLTSEEKDVGVAVDMDIGRRSAVFIGNGWSSFTSNVVHRRLVDGMVPISIRFW